MSKHSKCCARMKKLEKRIAVLEGKMKQRDPASSVNAQVASSQQSAIGFSRSVAINPPKVTMGCDAEGLPPNAIEVMMNHLVREVRSYARPKNRLGPR